MDRPRLIVSGLVAGAAGAVFVAAFGPLYGGVFLIPLVPFMVLGGVRRSTGALVGFGVVWTAVVVNHLLRGGASSGDAALLVVGLIPLAIAVLVTFGSSMAVVMPGPSRANG
jgi:hypothetical protein